MKNNKKITPIWLKNGDVQKLFGVLEADGQQARIVGGAVRNHLLGSPIKSDVDFAVTTTPKETIARLEAAENRVVPT